jgi:hypothetical protein
MPTKLSASPNPVVMVLPISGTIPPGKTKISFDHDIPDVTFGEDRDGTGFHFLDLKSSEMDAKAFEVTNLMPGLVLRIGMFSGKAIPGRTLLEQEALAIVTIFVLDSRPKALVNQHVFKSGGTFALWSVSTDKEDTWVFMQVGASPPITDAFGILSIDEPTREVISNPTKMHNVEAQPLTPGQFFSAIIRVSNSAGFWQCLQVLFKTKKRKVTGEITKIIIDNCGEDSPGEAAFWIDVIEFGTSGSETVIKHISFGDDEFKIRDGDEWVSEMVGQDWTFSVGPKAIVPEVNAFMSVRAHGKEYDAPFSPEQAISQLANNKMPMPTGMVNEKVTNQIATEKAFNLTGGPTPFEFTVEFKFSVRYI